MVGMWEVRICSCSSLPNPMNNRLKEEEKFLRLGKSKKTLGGKNLLNHRVACESYRSQRVSVILVWVKGVVTRTQLVGSQDL